jgi:hypothetical protein
MANIIHTFQILEVTMGTELNFTKGFGTLFTSPNENKSIQETFKNEQGKNF